MSKTDLVGRWVVVQKSTVERLVGIRKQEVGGVVTARPALELDQEPIACKIDVQNDLLHSTIFFLSTKSRATKGVTRLLFYLSF